MTLSVKQDRLLALWSSAVFMCLGVIGLGLLAAWPSPSAAAVALVYSPTQSKSDILRALTQTDVQIMRFGATPHVVIVAPQPNQSWSDLKTQTGALIVLNANGTINCITPYGEAS